MHNAPNNNKLIYIYYNINSLKQDKVTARTNTNTKARLTSQTQLKNTKTLFNLN